MHDMNLIVQQDRAFFEAERQANLKNHPDGNIRTDASFVYAEGDKFDFAGYERELERQQAFFSTTPTSATAAAAVNHSGPEKKSSV